MKGKDVAIIFDGTTQDGEALVVLVCFVESWTIKQRLVRLRLLKSSVNGDELARIIIEVLRRKINVQENSLLAAMRDRASVNTKALQTVSVLYPDMIDIGCISHFLNKVGEKCHIPTLKLFMATWNLIFSTSIRARNIWRGISGQSMPWYNSTRGWSYWECAMVVLQEWQHIRTFLTSNEDFAKTSRQRALQIFDVNTCKLKIELESVMEMEEFVKSTYTLEGDGTLILIAYEKLQMLQAFIRVRNFPTLTGVVQQLFPLNVAEQQRWYNYGFRECLMPAFEYYATVSRSIQVFQAAQLFSPKFVKVSEPGAATVDQIRAVPFLSNNEVIQSLKDELPTYIVKASQIPDEFDTLSDSWPWWKSVARELPAWSSAIQKLVVVQPSSAAAERAFSMLTTMFGEQQHDALEDYIETSLMLRVNDR